MLLNKVCARDADLGHRVLGLLVADEHRSGAHAGGSEESPTVASHASHEPISRLGQYRLLEKIGEGGMGEVWLAEQREPVRRRVALKLVKAGMNTREVIA